MTRSCSISWMPGGHRIGVRLVAWAMAWGTLALPARALPIDDAMQRVSASVWMVKAMDPQGQMLSYGSAVVTGAGQVVTNCHVLSQAATLRLTQGEQDLPARLTYADPDRDLCLLNAPQLVAPAVETAPAGSLSIGQSVFAVGWPGGQARSQSPGVLVGIQRNLAGDPEYLRTSAPSAEGSSGGGLFNDQGQLVGITSAALRNSTFNILFARPAAWIEDIPRRGAAALAAYRARPPSPTLPVRSLPAAGPADGHKR